MTSTNVPDRIFTEAELGQYDGKEGRPGYVAFDGIVYDTTDSWHWKEGNHWTLHDAGRDLTIEIDDAPHTEEMLRRLPVVGRLKKTQAR